MSMENHTNMISIIIACFNAEKTIERCIDAIHASSCRDYEIIVVNDGSTDTTKNKIQKYRSYANIHIIEHTHNTGPSYARNEAVKHAKGALILFLDADTRIFPDALSEMADFFHDHPSVGGIQAQLLLNMKTLDSAGHFLSITGFPYEIGAGENPKKYNTPHAIFGAKSAGMGIRKNIFNTVGGFDEHYVIYGEDTDLCWRVWLTGSAWYYVPSVQIFHDRKGSMNDQTSYRVYYEGAKNNTNYIIKNAPRSILTWMLPLHVVMWSLIAIKQLVIGNIQGALWIWRGLGWNIFHFIPTLQQRRHVQYMRTEKQCVDLFGNVSFIKLIGKGWRWFVHV